MSTTLIRGAWVLTIDADIGDVPDGAVLVDGRRIVEVGPYERLRAEHPGAAEAGGPHDVVLPGLVNAHTHLTEGLIQGMAERTSLLPWLQTLIAPVGAVITREDVKAGALLKCAELLLAGVTTVNDMSTHRNPGSLATLGSADALDAAGLRGVVSYGTEDLGTSGGPQVHVDEHHALADRVADRDLLTFRLGIGTVLGVSDGLFATLVDEGRREGWGVHTHLHEVREEVTGCLLEHGRTSIQQAGRVGLLELPTIAAHCIWCSDRDVGLLADRQVAVAHNPVANAILASGICPVGRLQREGVTVGIGTDGAASNDNQDMLAAIKLAALLPRLRDLDPEAMTAREVLRMATLDGARALRLQDVCGSLTAGKDADVLVLAGDTPELALLHDPYQAVVYSATSRCVKDVMVAGERRVRDGRLVDLDPGELARAARPLGIDLARRAGLGGLSSYCSDHHRPMETPHAHR